MQRQLAAKDAKQGHRHSHVHLVSVFWTVHERNRDVYFVVTYTFWLALRHLSRKIHKRSATLSTRDGIKKTVTVVAQTVPNEREIKFALHCYHYNITTTVATIYGCALQKTEIFQWGGWGGVRFTFM